VVGFGTGRQKKAQGARRKAQGKEQVKWQKKSSFNISQNFLFLQNKIVLRS
jgi:hypothetical protein